MYEQDLVLNNLQGLICCKTQASNLHKHTYDHICIFTFKAISYIATHVYSQSARQNLKKLKIQMGSREKEKY